MYFNNFNTLIQNQDEVKLGGKHVCQYTKNLLIFDGKWYKIKLEGI